LKHTVGRYHVTGKNNLVSIGYPFVLWTMSMTWLWMSGTTTLALKIAPPPTALHHEPRSSKLF
jgi:hypothetical protein